MPMLTNNNPTRSITKETFDNAVKQLRETAHIPYQAGRPRVLPLPIYNVLKDRGYIKDGKLTKKGIKDLL